MRRQHTGRPCRATIPLCRETNAASACARTRCDVNGRVHYALSSAEHHVDTANHRTDGCEKYAREVCYIATPPRLLLLLLQSPTPPGWTRSTAWKHETTGTMRGVRCHVCTRIIYFGMPRAFALATSPGVGKFSRSQLQPLRPVRPPCASSPRHCRAAVSKARAASCSPS